MYCCSDMTNLTSIEIPSIVTSIGEHAFYNCSGLTSVTIPSNVTSIGLDAFHRCTNLTSVTWNAKNCPNNGSFGDQVESFTFGNEVETIPLGCCFGMTNLTSIEIPSSVTSIGVAAFYDCSGLTSITIPANVTSIGPLYHGWTVGAPPRQQRLQVPFLSVGQALHPRRRRRPPENILRDFQPCNLA